METEAGRRFLDLINRGDIQSWNQRHGLDRPLVRLNEIYDFAANAIFFKGGCRSPVAYGNYIHNSGAVSSGGVALIHQERAHEAEHPLVVIHYGDRLFCHGGCPSSRSVVLWDHVRDHPISIPVPSIPMCMPPPRSAYLAESNRE